HQRHSAILQKVSGQKPVFGGFGFTSTPAFGSTASPTFGSTGTTFGVSSAPVFGSGGTFGASGTPAFGASSTPAFGASSNPAFGASTTTAFVPLRHSTKLRRPSRRRASPARCSAFSHQIDLKECGPKVLDASCLHHVASARRSSRAIRRLHVVFCTASRPSRPAPRHPQLAPERATEPASPLVRQISPLASRTTASCLRHSRYLLAVTVKPPRTVKHHTRRRAHVQVKIWKDFASAEIKARGRN
ncbi:hypothetical protein U1Q18_013938, partial [Sarracenia purpurea var. burkii]